MWLVSIAALNGSSILVISARPETVHFYRSSKDIIVDNQKQTDPCGRCGCQRKYHKPDKYYLSHKFRVTGGATSRVYMIPVRAPTCCDKCPHCLCFCTAFVEPFEGQPRTRCIYENEDHTHRDPTTTSYPISISSRVPPVQPDFIPPDDSGDADPLPTGSQVPTKRTKKKGTRTKTTYKRGSETTSLRWEP